MRVLLLRRQALGGIATYSDALVAPLAGQGVQAVSYDATPWLPRETSLAANRGTAKQMRELADGFDLVHAFGYRAAWACSEVFGHKEAWVYSAYDVPKSRQPLVISHLNDALAGICSSFAVRNELRDADALHLDVIPPGAAVPTDQPERETVRTDWGIAPETLLIVALGRLIPERGFDALLKAMDPVWDEHPAAQLILAGSGEQEEALEQLRQALSRPEQVKLPGWTMRPHSLLAAADLVVVPSRRAGFSMVAAEAMRMGVPVMLREIDGLSEQVEAHVSGLLFESDSDLASRLPEALSMQLTLQAIGNAGRVRADDLYSIDKSTASIARVYEDVLS